MLIYERWGVPYSSEPKDEAQEDLKREVWLSLVIG